MRSYRVARRAFLRSIGGAAGLYAILKNLEARAQGAPAPPRLLVVHHPQGTVQSEWLPATDDAEAPLPRILAPFEPVRDQMTIIDGLDGAQGGPGGLHEKGTVTLMTGAPTRILRDLPELDDPAAGGPSIDQLLLARSSLLQGTAVPSLQAGVDGRVEAGEIGSRCLSYSVNRRPVIGANGTGEEHIPLLPLLGVSELLGATLGTLLPMGAEGVELRRERQAELSVLDFLLDELRELRALAPSNERVTLDAHEAAIRELERRLVALSSNGCSPASVLEGGYAEFADDGRVKSLALEPLPETEELGRHGQIGEMQLRILSVVFQCDLSRVATFQWAPSASFVALGGELRVRHGALAARVAPEDLEASAAERSAEAELLVAVDEWYSQKLADFVSRLSSTPDPSGGSLLDSTLVAYVSDVASPGGPSSPLPTLLFGGRSLGVEHGRLLSYPGRSMNDFWLSLAEVLGVSVESLEGEKILTGAHQGPLPGLFP